MDNICDFIDIDDKRFEILAEFGHYFIKNKKLMKVLSKQKNLEKIFMIVKNMRTKEEKTEFITNIVNYSLNRRNKVIEDALGMLMCIDKYDIINDVLEDEDHPEREKSMQQLRENIKKDDDMALQMVQVMLQTPLQEMFLDRLDWSKLPFSYLTTFLCYEVRHIVLTFAESQPQPGIDHLNVFALHYILYLNKSKKSYKGLNGTYVEALIDASKEIQSETKSSETNRMLLAYFLFELKSEDREGIEINDEELVQLRKDYEHFKNPLKLKRKVEDE